MSRLASLTEALLFAAKQAGAEAADAMALSGTSQSIDIRAGALEQAERSEATEIGLRVLIGGRQACVSASDTSPATLARLAERAVAMAREAPEDPYAGLAAPDQIAKDWDLAALQLVEDAEEPSAARLESLAREAEARASVPSQPSTGAVLSDALNLEHVLCQINAQCCNLHVGRSCLFKWVGKHLHFGTLRYCLGGRRPSHWSAATD